MSDIPIPVTIYRDIEIQYREDDDRWRFEHGGREKSAATLREARDLIDKLPKKPFKRFECLYGVGWARPEYINVTVTSMAEGFGINGEYWISYTDDKHRPTRSKVRRDTLIKLTKINQAIIQQMQDLADQSDVLNRQIGELSTSLERIDGLDQAEQVTTRAYRGEMDKALQKQLVEDGEAALSGDKDAQQKRLVELAREMLFEVQAEIEAAQTVIARLSQVLTVRRITYLAERGPM